MAENSRIEWCDNTFNPWRGCAHVSAGCINCYAERQARRNPALLGEWGTGKRVIANESYWQQPLKWNRKAEREGRRYRVFCGSMMDVFENLPELEEPRNKLLMTILVTPNLDWLLLTKRPENAQDLCWKRWRAGIPENVWIGVSTENQESADERIPILLEIPAAVRFLSCEPLIGPINLNEWLLSEHGRRQIGARPGIGWVIVGGESGPKARPMHPAWVRSIRDQCVAAGVPFFFKQWGEWMPGAIGGGCDTKIQVMYPDGRIECRTDLAYRDVMHPFYGESHGAHIISRVGKRVAGRLLDGRTWEESPIA